MRPMPGSLEKRRLYSTPATSYHCSRGQPSQAPGLSGLRRVLADLDDHLAAVLALQQADQRARRVFQPGHDVLAVHDAALAQPGAHAAAKLRQQVLLMVVDYEALD